MSVVSLSASSLKPFMMLLAAFSSLSCSIRSLSFLTTMLTGFSLSSISIPPHDTLTTSSNLPRMHPPPTTAQQPCISPSTPPTPLHCTHRSGSKLDGVNCFEKVPRWGRKRQAAVKESLAGACGRVRAVTSLKQECSMLGTEDCMATEDDDVMALLSQALPQLPDGDIIGGMDVKDILRVPRLSDGESSSDSSSPCSAFTSEPASSSSSGTSSITPHGPLTAASVALCSEAISVHSTRHAIPPPQPMPVEGILLRITDITIPNHKAVLEAKQRYTDYAMLLYEHYKISEEQLIRWLEGRAALLPSSRDEVAPEVDELRHKYARAFQELEKRFVRNIREVAERAAAMKEEGAGAPIDRALDELRPEQVNVLENWIQCNPDVLVPTTEQLHALSVLTGASEELVYMWCAARRLRAKQEGGM